MTGGGMVFAEGDAEMLARHLRKLRASPALRDELARTGRTAVERRFSVPAATDPLERMLARAAAAHAAGRRVQAS